MWREPFALAARESLWVVSSDCSPTRPRISPATSRIHASVIEGSLPGVFRVRNARGHCCGLKTSLKTTLLQKLSGGSARGDCFACLSIDFVEHSHPSFPNVARIRANDIGDDPSETATSQIEMRPVAGLRPFAPATDLFEGWSRFPFHRSLIWALGWLDDCDHAATTLSGMVPYRVPATRATSAC